MADEQNIASLRDFLSARPQRPPPPPVRGGATLRRLPWWVPRAIRTVGTTLVRPLSDRRFAAATANRPLRLHLGCGFAHLDGWLNIDLFGTRTDVPWDLRWGIPFPDCSVEAIFHEHLLEHLSLQDGFQLTQECLRVLQPAGVIRIGVPDAGMCVDSYCGRADPGWAQSRPTGMLAVQELFYEAGHQAMYDAETLTGACLAAGFVTASRRDAGQGSIQPCPDTPARASGTLYVEARKAG